MSASVEKSERVLSPSEERVAEYHWYRDLNEAVRAARQKYADVRDIVEYSRLIREEVARNRGITVEEVDAARRTISVAPSVIQPTPQLVIDEYMLGYRSRESMIERLKTWPFTFPAHVYENPDGTGMLIAIESSTWADVATAWRNGRIDDEAFQEIKAAAGGPA